MPDLERVLRAVVGTALGTLAQELWGEDADAVLALTRLRGLEARVEVGDRVTRRTAPRPTLARPPTRGPAGHLAGPVGRGWPVGAGDLVTLAPTRAELALAELRLRLAPLARALAVEVDRSAEIRARISADRPTGRPSLEQHARMQVARATAFTSGPRQYGAGIGLSEVERDLVDRLAEQAAHAGVRLPGQVLTDGGIGPTDLAVLLLAAAPALEPAFGAAYAYLQDSYEATAPGPALAVRLLATSAETERCVAEAAGPLGRLRSTGLVEASMSDRLAGPLLRPAAGLVELLRGSTVDLGLLGLLPAPDEAGPWPAGVDADEVADVAEALAIGEVDLVGVWGRGARRRRCAGRCPVRNAAPVVRVGPEEAESGLHRAGLVGGVCVVVVPEGATEIAQDDLVDVLTRSTTRVVRARGPAAAPVPPLGGQAGRRAGGRRTRPC